jgi:adenosyl cobinamide kinase/adenosyl cobinamide phosphate guanylyltransferase
MAHLTVVVGGRRSGKNRFAETWAGAAPPVTYAATAMAGDAAEEVHVRLAGIPLRIK